MAERTINQNDREAANQDNGEAINQDNGEITNQDDREAVAREQSLTHSPRPISRATMVMIGAAVLFIIFIILFLAGVFSSQRGGV